MYTLTLRLRNIYSGIQYCSPMSQSVLKARTTRDQKSHEKRPVDDDSDGRIVMW